MDWRLLGQYFIRDALNHPRIALSITCAHWSWRLWFPGLTDGLEIADNLGELEVYKSFRNTPQQQIHGYLSIAPRLARCVADDSLSVHQGCGSGGFVLAALLIRRLLESFWARQARIGEGWVWGGVCQFVAASTHSGIKAFLGRAPRWVWKMCSITKCWLLWTCEW